MSFNEVFTIITSGTTTALVAGVVAFPITVVPDAEALAGAGAQPGDMVLLSRAVAGGAGALGSYLGNITSASAGAITTATLNIASYANAGNFNNTDISTVNYVVLRRNV
jgi:cell wall-associated NlpC family hydrolase